MSDSLQLHGLQHFRLSCPSTSPKACSNSCPLSQWCHPTILPSVTPFSSCLQSFPASGSLPMSRLFGWGAQSNGASASASVLPMNIQGWFPSSRVIFILRISTILPVKNARSFSLAATNAESSVYTEVTSHTSLQLSVYVFVSSVQTVIYWGQVTGLIYFSNLQCQESHKAFKVFAKGIN